MTCPKKSIGNKAAIMTHAYINSRFFIVYIDARWLQFSAHLYPFDFYLMGMKGKVLCQFFFKTTA